MSDYHRINALISLIYEAAINPELWDSFIAQCLDVVHAENGSLIVLDRINPISSIVTFSGSNFPDPKEYGERIQEDYWLNGAMALPGGAIALGTEMADINTMRKTDYYIDIAHPVDHEYLVGGVIEKNTERQSTIGFIRGRRPGNFDQTAKDFVKILLPHLEKANFIHRQLEQKANLEMAVDQSGYGMLLLDRNRRLLYLNRQAELVIQQQDGITLRSGTLQLHDQRGQASLERAIHYALNTNFSAEAGGGFVAARRPSGRIAFQIRVCPLNRNSEQDVIKGGSACAVFLHDPVRPVGSSNEYLMIMYGLTRAESNICAQLYRGDSLNNICDALKITRNTAKTHLKHIFNKCDVRTQAELMRLIGLGFGLEEGA